MPLSFSPPMTQILLSKLTLECFLLAGKDAWLETLVQDIPSLDCQMSLKQLVPSCPPITHILLLKSRLVCVSRAGKSALFIDLVQVSPSLDCQTSFRFPLDPDPPITQMLLSNTRAEWSSLSPPDPKAASAFSFQEEPGTTVVVVVLVVEVMVVLVLVVIVVVEEEEIGSTTLPQPVDQIPNNKPQIANNPKAPIINENLNFFMFYPI